MKLLEELSLASIDCVFADPPFNIGFPYPDYDDSLPPEKFLGWSKLWMLQVHRVLKPGHAFWLAMGDEYVAELKCIATRLGFELVNWVIWGYEFGTYTEHKFVPSKTHLLFFWSPSKKVKLTFHPPRVESMRQKMGDKRANPNGRVPSDVWDYPRVCGSFLERVDYTCQMPEDLVTRILLTCTNPGDLVLDPFLGSGTTAVVAQRLKRNFLGFDISPKSIFVTERRLQ